MRKKRSAGKVVDTTITYILLIVVAFIFFFPCLWLILASFSKSGTIYSFGNAFPQTGIMTLNNNVKNYFYCGLFIWNTFRCYASTMVYYYFLHN